MRRRRQVRMRRDTGSPGWGRGRHSAASSLSRCGWLGVAICVLAGCGTVDSSPRTLPPLGATIPPSTLSTSLVAPGRHHAWFEVHHAAISDELDQIRSFLDELRSAPDTNVLTLICRRGVDLDRADYREAYEAPDAHPGWVHAIDLTRWMIVSCDDDARRSLDELSPNLEATLRRFESWSDLPG